jgi:hypothetical protein
MRTFLRVLVVALTALIGGASTGTTTAGAATFAYDDPTIARVGVHQIGNVEATPFQLSVVREGSALRVFEAGGPSATSSRSFIATNTVRPGTDLVKYEAYPPAATSPRGFVGGPVCDTLQPGTAISRYGGEGGTFASPAGTPFSARGLPPGHEALGESRYVFAQPLEIDAGIAAYRQGGGGGIQYDLPRSISDLVNDGILKRLP